MRTMVFRCLPNYALLSYPHQLKVKYPDLHKFKVKYPVTPEFKVRNQNPPQNFGLVGLLFLKLGLNRNKPFEPRFKTQLQH